MAVQGRKKVELLEEVRKLQERLEHLSAATAEGVFLHEAGRILHLNRSGATMFGYRPEELLGRSVVDLSPPGERPVVLARIASGREGPWETKGLKKDGSVFPVELHARNVAVGPETVRAVTARDLTERRKAEQELRESRERYRSILENLRAIAYRANAGSHRFLFLAGSVSEIVGRDPAELVSGRLLWEDLVHPEDLSELRAESARRASSGGTSDSTYRVVRPDGTVVWVRDIARSASVGSEVLLDGLVVDVTLSKATEQELRRTRDLLLRTEQLARIGSWSWEPDSGRTTWSPGMYRHYGLSPDETSSPVDISLRAIHPEDLPRLREHMFGARVSGKLDPIEYRVLVEGATRHHGTEGEVHRDPETGSARMVGFVQDVTALREMEEERLSRGARARLAFRYLRRPGSRSRDSEDDSNR